MTSEYLTSNAIITIAVDRKGEDFDVPIHKNVRITDNYFEMFDHPLLFVECTKNIIFKNNIIQYVNTHKPWHKNTYTFNLKDVRIFLLRIIVSEISHGSQILNCMRQVGKN